jgi:hypothetical protein
MRVISKYVNYQKKRTSKFDIFYSQYSQKHVSAGILGIFRVMSLRLYSCNNITLKMARIPVERFC